MRIGIWCDYGFTLEPSEGIGVFVDNLARGLVQADGDCQIMMMAHPGEEHKLSSTVAQGEGRIAVVSVPRLSRARRFARRRLNKLLRATGHKANRENWWANLLTGTVARLAAVRDRAVEAYVDQCDVWLLPYVALDQEFSKPTVVAIHDLVCYHFTDMMSANKLAALKELVDKVAGRATIAACMSEFIRDNDLFGMLNLPASRVRVIKPAVPNDMGLNSASDESSMLWPLLAKHGIKADAPYLFYPAAFRSYKNHGYLLRVLHALKARSSRPWKLIFTGIRHCPAELVREIQHRGLSEDVVALGKVSRPQLEGLYRNAFATVVPSLYEQGSFPIMEALHCECPVAASGIASLREQFQSMGDSMLFFDPQQPDSLVQVIETIARDRERIIASQRQGFRAMRSTTWEETAQEWLSVLREATNLPGNIGQLAEFKRAG